MFFSNGQPEVLQSAGIGSAKFNKGRSAMEMVSPRQSRHIAALFTTNVDWEAIPFEAGEAISGDPTGFGRNATRFVQNGGRVTVTVTDGIIPPPGGRIQILTLVVDELRPWKDAVKAAGPDTGRDWEIWKVGEQYPPTPGSRSSLKSVILANFGRTIESSEEALAWGREQKLAPHTPRAIFSAAEFYPDLNQYLGMESMAVVSLKQCACDGRQCVPDVWFYGAQRGADLYRFGLVWGGGGCWIAFDRE